MREMIYQTTLFFGKRGRRQTAVFVPYGDCIAGEIAIRSSEKAIVLTSIDVMALDGSVRPVLGKSILSTVILQAGQSLRAHFERRDRRFTRPIEVKLHTTMIPR